MKALTIRQPYASLIAAGMKTVETRSWTTMHRGPIAIHAAQAVDDDVELAVAGFTAKQTIPMPIGCVIATARLVDVVPMLDRYDTSDSYVGPHVLVDEASAVYVDRHTQWSLDGQRRFGDYAPGRYAWLLTDIVPIAPQPATGSLQLWEWEPAH